MSEERGKLMRLEELLDAIRGSTRDDWFVMKSNTLLNQVSTDDKNIVYAGCHTNRASYRPDISIGLA